MDWTLGDQLADKLSTFDTDPSCDARPKALWASTTGRGGVTTYVRDISQTSLWNDWNVRLVSTHRDGRKLTRIGEFVVGAASFVRNLIRFRPDVVHLHTCTEGSFIRKAILLSISRLAGVPVVLHMHDSRIQDYYEGSPPLLRMLIRASLSRADAVVALGDSWAARLQELAPQARIVSVPNGVRLGRQVRQPGPGEAVHVVFLGRIGEWKGTFRLLEAWARLGNPAATLTIAGDGEVEEARRLVEELGLQGQVEVSDWLSPDAVGDLLDRSQVLVLPSRNEGQPMAVLEAMARGLCIVASEAGGLADMIGGGCGVVVSPNDVDSIAEGLRMVIEDAELRTRYGASAYYRISERYDVSSAVRRLDALYRELTPSLLPVTQR